MATFPHPCGEEFEQAVVAGADPATVVPDGYIVVLGGTAAPPDAGDTFSCAIGPTLEAAAAAVPHNQLRYTTLGAIRRPGGIGVWVPEFSRRGTMNKQHVDVTEAGPTAFGVVTPNPVPKTDRIDGGK